MQDLLRVLVHEKLPGKDREGGEDLSKRARAAWALHFVTASMALNWAGSVQLRLTWRIVCEEWLGQVALIAVSWSWP